ncbi:MAG: methyltransferase domain-containing protein [Arenimonas sp.]|jgi:predicted nicotinamide N-methyase
MPGYSVHTTTVHIGDVDYRIRALSDKQQFADAGGEAERAGISSATWPIFGVLWPAGSVLAEEMCTFEVAGKRVLEIGCGLGLSSLVLQGRGADITASDHHPLAGEFLAANAILNDLPPIAFRIAQWSGPNPDLGSFDVIIGGDVLYQRDHVGLLSGFLAEHARPEAEILITDPGRSHGNALNRALAAQGYECTEERRRFEDSESPPFRGRLLSYRR